MDPGGLGQFSPERSNIGSFHKGKQPEVVTSPGQAQSDIERAEKVVLTSPALFPDDSCSPQNKINVFSSTRKLYFVL
jgi:hypothetical protein